MGRSVAACLASILEIDVTEVPVPDAEHPEPWTVWRTWLSQRGLGLVPIADPATFNWPGPWLAMLGDEPVGAVAFGAPPGLVWNPSGSGEPFEAVRSGYLIAPADVATWRPAPTGSPRRAGTVESVLVAPVAEAAMVTVDRAAVEPGRGLHGDRYFDARGTFSNAHGRGHDLTLIEAEVLEDLELPAHDARRNVVTRGIDLNDLVGRHFTIGAIECFGQRLCEPCAHLERLGAPGTLRALIHKGGLRADVLTAGEVGVGDTITGS
jgi:hypothetical protein